MCADWHLNLNYLFLKTYQQMLHCFITCTLIVNHFLQRIFFLLLVQHTVCQQKLLKPIGCLLWTLPPFRDNWAWGLRFTDHFLCVQERSYLSVRHRGITTWSFFLILGKLELSGLSSVGGDGSPSLKAAEMKDLKRHYSALASFYSLFCACLRELYGFYHQRARMLF